MTPPLANIPVATAEQCRWFRFRRSGLAEPFSTPEATAHALVGIQAQILPAAALALWNRTPNLSYGDFDTLLYNTRSLVKLWGQRHTLHVYASPDWPLMHGARELNRTWWERQAAQENEHHHKHRQLIEDVAEMLRKRPTMGRSDLRSSNLEIQDELLSAWGGIFADLVRLGYACHAGRIGSEGHFAHREQWLPGLRWEPPDPVDANVTILHRYLQHYGPSTLADFAYWRGVSIGEARPWLQRLANDIQEAEIDGKRQLLLREDIEELLSPVPDGEGWPVRMLYRFDPLLLAHKDKAWVVPSDHYKQVWRPAGHIEGVVLDQGTAVATWRYDRTGQALTIQVHPFNPRLPHSVRPALRRLAPKIAAFFGLSLTDLRIS
jgi:hypothetical protein